MGWTPEQFWRASVPEFWAAVDWIAEKNLEVEERVDEVKAGSSRPSARVDEVREVAEVNGYRIPGGHSRVRHNPNLRVKPNPAFVAWREELRARGI